MLRRLRGTSVAVLLGGLLGLSQPATVDAASPDRRCDQRRRTGTHGPALRPDHHILRWYPDSSHRLPACTEQRPGRATADVQSWLGRQPLHRSQRKRLAYRHGTQGTGNGYFVATFDQRGFGESGGRANVQDPQIEGRDIKTLLDWAEGALTPHLAYLRGDPLVGGIGLSYGGGFQLIGAAVDPRFDALVPMITE